MRARRFVSVVRPSVFPSIARSLASLVASSLIADSQPAGRRKEVKREKEGGKEGRKARSRITAARLELIGTYNKPTEKGYLVLSHKSRLIANALNRWPLRGSIEKASMMSDIDYTSGRWRIASPISVRATCVRAQQHDRYSNAWTRLCFHFRKRHFFI